MKVPHIHKLQLIKFKSDQPSINETRFFSFFSWIRAYIGHLKNKLIFMCEKYDQRFYIVIEHIKFLKEPDMVLKYHTFSLNS